MSNWIDFNELVGSPHLRVPVGAGPPIKARRRRAADCDHLTKARPRSKKATRLKVPLDHFSATLEVWAAL